MKKNLIKKRIAFFHELDKGGARRSSNEFSKSLSKNFIIDLFIVDQTIQSVEKQYYNSIIFHKFIPKRWKGNNWKIRLYKDTAELIKLYFLHRKIAKKIERSKYDLVFAFPSKYTQAPFILRLLKLPVVYYCQEPLRIVYEDLFKVGREVGVGRFYYEKTNRFIRKILDRENIKKANVILANSNYTKKNIKSAYGLKSRTVYMGVDVDFFSPSKIKKKFDILYIGSLDKADNYELLKKTLDEMNYPLDKVRFVFREKEWISSNESMRDLYRSAKILVCLGYKEPFGLLPIEALACGLPVVALNDGGYKETVIQNVNGLLVDNNTKSLSTAISKILFDENTYVRMSKKARNVVLNSWGWNNSKEILTNIFNKAIYK